MTQAVHFADEAGNYLGAFGDGAEPPEGAIERPAPQNAAAKWVDGAWHEPALEAPILSASRFEWLLAYTGLDDVWAALETSLKGVDRAAYATLREQRSKQKFHLAATLAMVEAFRPQAQAAAPDMDLSETAIRDAWALAAGATK